MQNTIVSSWVHYGTTKYISILAIEKIARNKTTTTKNNLKNTIINFKMACNENQLIKFRIGFLYYQIMLSQYIEREMEGEWEEGRKREKKEKFLKSI